MGWRRWTKVVVQKGCGALPDPQRANRSFQEHVTRSTRLPPSYVDQQLGWAGLHLGALERHGGTIRGATVVELGSGWFPIVPVCLFLAGADRVVLVDLEDLGRPELLARTIDRVLAAARAGRLDDLGRGPDPERVRALERAGRRLSAGSERHDVLASLGLEVRPGDARRLEFDDDPALICSNTVLEHIPAPVLEGILRRFGEVAGPATVMSRVVDLCDHHAYIDPHVGVYHFLRYRDLTWRLLDNSVQPMNRLRASEHRWLYRRAGLPLTEEHLEDADPSRLAGVPLAPRFRAMDSTDVACTRTWLVSAFGTAERTRDATGPAARSARRGAGGAQRLPDPGSGSRCGGSGGRRTVGAQASE